MMYYLPTRLSPLKNLLFVSKVSEIKEEGVVKLTLEAVAQRAGVSKGGLLYHYPSKEALIKIGYKVKKIDIVGHSMGGNLIRLYLQSDDYKFDIHKLITLNTPHSGTQLANEALFTIIKTSPHPIRSHFYSITLIIILL